ncbi:MAG TPA: ATPase, T2SS/T4P/T4SS family [Microbacteriaceae bacterium]|nr:ATPase, T2SS/T4P/T4SS family [Microbacteriaceae bacterium]
MSELSKRIAASLRQGSVQREDVDAAVVEREVRRAVEHSLGADDGGVGLEADIARDVLAELVGFGPLQPLLSDDSIEEIWVNSPHEVFIARDGVHATLPIQIPANQLQLLVERMLARTGRRVDLSQPFVDASLPDGSRLHVVIPDVTRAHWSVNIRKFRQDVRSLEALTQLGMLSAEAASFLRSAMRSGLNVLVSGPTHAGKTTLLTALLDAGRPEDRVVTVEETFEIACPQPDHVAMQCRAPNIEGNGEITLRRLVKEALRMRPDRLVVGEVREAESLDLLIALNSGIPGLATIHANSARDALLKMCTLPLLAGRNIDAAFVVPTVRSSVDLVVHIARTETGTRYVSEIVAVDRLDSSSHISVIELFRAFGSTSPTLRTTGSLPTDDRRFAALSQWARRGREVA